MANPRFLLLRPEHKCRDSADYLARKGLPVVGLPLIKTKALTEGGEQLAAALTPLTADDGIIVVSTTAAELATGHVPLNEWPDARIYAVGESTAAILKKNGHRVITPSEQSSEGLLALADLTAPEGKKLLIIKGQGGRETLAQTLNSRGAQVSFCDLYQRLVNTSAQPTRAWQVKDINAIIATSGELIDTAFTQLDTDFLRSRPWIVVSQRVADIARSHGVEEVVVSQSAKDDDLLAAARAFMETSMVAETDTTPTTPPSQAATESTKPKSNVGLWFFTLLNFALLLGVIGGAYWGWMQWQTLQQQQDAKVNAALADANQRMQAQQQRQLSEVDARVEPYAKELDGLKQMTEALRQQLGDVSGRRPSDWVLAEADYLVRVAGRKIWLEKDIATAILMLEAADYRLQDMADPSLLPVREKLAVDIAGLRQIKETEVTPLALKIGGLLQQVDTLPMVVVNLPSTALATPVAMANGDAPWWQRGWEAIASVFDRMVEVHHRTVIQEPLLTEQQKWLVRQQLRHYLLQAQVALLKEQGAVYMQGMGMAMKTLDDYFDPATTGVLAARTAMEELAQIQLNREYPQSLESAELLRDVLERRINAIFASTAFEVQP